jgi:arginine-tRNA-protein transferase
MFVDPRTTVDSRLYSQLSVLGFRRSGSHLYRPHCSNCNACIPARVPVNQFMPRRTQRRIWNRNRDIEVRRLEDGIAKDPYFELYRRYIEARHRDGDMYPPLRDQYESFLSNEWGVTEYYRLDLADQLAGIAVVDRLEDGLSAIYTFFEPALDRRSLGTFTILWQLQQTVEDGLDYLYLGYWIKQCQKMAYKIQFRPLELFINGRWVDLL